MNEGRLAQALEFLDSIPWIRWFETEKKIIVYKGKGR